MIVFPNYWEKISFEHSLTEDVHTINFKWIATYKEISIVVYETRSL